MRHVRKYDGVFVMPAKGLRPGFVFPMRVGEFGVSFARFQILGVKGEFIVPGSNDKPLGPNVFSGATTGPCRIEVYGPGRAPYDINPKEALFISGKVQFGFGRSPNSPDPFAIIQSQYANELLIDLQTFVGKPINLVFRPTDEERNLRPDPRNVGWTLGWGVFRNEPWHFAELFNSREEAQVKLEELGSEYEVAYGSNRDGSDDFITTGYDEH